MRKVVGLARGVCVAANGFRELLERRLALAATAAAGGDLPGRAGNRLGRTPDLGNERAELRHRRVGVMNELAECAFEVGGRTLREIASGKRDEHGRNVLETFGRRFEKHVDAACELRLETAQALRLDSL